MTATDQAETLRKLSAAIASAGCRCTDEDACEAHELLEDLDGPEYLPSEAPRRGPTQARAETRTVTENLDAAMVLTSDTGRMSLPRYRHVDGTLSRFEVEPLHRPVLDLDMPAVLLSSSTPGHHHLLIDSPMPWSTYLDLLRALVAAGLVESGYVGAAEERGHTGVRVPWFRKGDVPPNVDGTVPAVPFGDVEPFGVAS